MKEKRLKETTRVFLKSMLYTAATIVLLLIGYFTAGYFFSNL